MNPIALHFRKFAAWLVHLLTASTAVIGVLTLLAIHEQRFVDALWWMCAAILIDAIDGTFARGLHVKKFIPSIDGALLDNIVDYLNYVITPCFFLMLNESMLPSASKLLVVTLICLSSAYQFTQMDAKTPDHFFKGFPSYWNIVLLYLFIFHTPMLFNAWFLVILAILVFVPIKYVYPSRLDYLTELPWLRVTMFIASICYGLASAGLLYTYPSKHPLIVFYVFAYMIFYFGFSLFRTYYPLLIKNLPRK